MATFMDFINAPAKGLRDLIRPVAPWLVTPLQNPFEGTGGSRPSRPLMPNYSSRFQGFPGTTGAPIGEPTTFSDAARSRASVRGRIPTRTTAFTPEPPVVKDAAYYMNLATQQLPGIDFSGLQARAKTSVSDTDARVKAMYRAMRDIQAEEAATREGSRTAAGESIATSATQAASDIQQGYDNAISSLADEMAALGLGETLAQEPAQRVAAESGRNQAISRQLGQISGNLNTELGQGESAFNQQTRDITGLEGVDFRSQLQSDLLNQLAQLDMAQQQQNQQLPMQRMNYAQGLRGYDQSFEPYTPSFSEQLDAQRLAGSASASEQKRFDDAFFKFYTETGDQARAYQMAQDYINGVSQ
jgi:hypothetical protein